MSALRIHLFGSVELRRDGHVLPSFPTQKARDLFAYLVLHRARVFPREVLVGVFWGDRPERAARRNLRTDLWRIRRTISPGPPVEEVLLVQGHSVGLDQAADWWLDVEEFERRLEWARPDAEGRLTSEGARELEEAVGLYRGDLLEEVYEDWCLYERERLRLLYISALERLMAHHQARGEWDTAIEAGQRLLHADGVLEHVHRELMRCYHLQGNRPAAMRQFAHCEQVLRTELDVEPMKETTAVYDAVRSNRTSALLERAEHLLTEVDATLAELRRVTPRLEESRRRLHRALGSPESAPGAREAVPRRI